MAAPDYFIKSLLRVAKIQGREVLEAIVTGQFNTQIKANGGKELTGATVNGKSFTYTSDIGVKELMGKCEEALEWIDSHTPEQLADTLTRPLITTAVARFRSYGGGETNAIQSS